MLKWSLRLEPAELIRLARSFGFSLAAHLLVLLLWLLIVTGNKHHWFDSLHVPKWLQTSKMLTQVLQKKQPPPPPPVQEPPMVFVDVSPAQSTAEPPKDAKYYSDRNSRAANPKAEQETGVPKIEGTQKEVVKTEDVSKPKKFEPLQPAPPPVAQASPQPQEELKPKAVKPPGDLALAKPEPKPREGQGEAPRPRPRTLAEVKARLQPESRIPGQKINQDGGVKRQLQFAALDAKSTAFGAYDRALVDAISQRWYALLDERGYASDDRGKVVVNFVLHPDGRVSDMAVGSNSAGELLGLLCQKAIMDPAPFATWPSDMRRMIGDSRAIQFTFYYN